MTSRFRTTSPVRRAALWLLALLPLACAGPAPDAAPAEPAADAPRGWVQLFDGKSLDGWTPKFVGEEVGVNYKDTFRVEDGLLCVRYDQYDAFDGRFGHLFFDVPFAHYRLRVEYRFTGEPCPGGPGWAWRNNGVMLHGQAPETMGLNQDFPCSIEAQLLGGAETGERSTANLCTPGTNVVMNGELVTRHCTDSSSRTFRGDQWVTVELEVHGGGVIRQYADGELVLEYEQPQLDPHDADAQRLLVGRASPLLESGTISIQSESAPIDFRRIELLELDE
ncbi:MAG: DUF1080 domain-containing protein [Planctomycetes bacterium]|nr:DUF1080 domain-containing protein [Planctomycetota bacterium]